MRGRYRADSDGKKIGVTRNTVYADLIILANQGVICKSGDGYEITANADLERLQAERVQADDGITERRQKLLSILSQEGDIGPTAFAQRLNVARNTVYNDLSALAEQGIVHKNGTGWKVQETQ